MIISFVMEMVNDHRGISCVDELKKITLFKQLILQITIIRFLDF